MGRRKPADMDQTPVAPTVMESDRGQLTIARVRIRKLEADVANLSDFSLKLAARVLHLELQVSLMKDVPLAEVTAP